MVSNKITGFDFRPLRDQPQKPLPGLHFSFTC
jgi:hypothetical protein